ncbi:MAG TPA: nitrite reductase, copper-containing [Candidatus Thioglobus autotrophicus]|nr:nitrite reductase, copper-containing [Candidatus Thioglobus sp.]HIL03980.1 nitrite reductase, copper-containing [Candidatus Thioglobus autotrophicus]
MSFIISIIVSTNTALAVHPHSPLTGGLEGFDVGVEPDIEGLPRVKQILVAPPYLPQHDQVATDGPKIVEIEMTVIEKEIEISPGVFVQAMTFNGSNPGPLIVVHEGDYIELTLKNPRNSVFEHNIDFHAATGAMGAGALTHVSPGEEVTVRWKADKVGTFVYHCAPGGTMIPYHVIAGMNGAIMVLPRDGLKNEKGKLVEYDKAFYIGEQDWYVAKDDNGNFKRYNSPAEAMGDTMKVMRGLIPTHLTFNGKVGALTGDNAMTASVGETVLFIHSQANRDSRVHLIGGHADLFWHGGSFNDAPMTNRETWPVFAGESVAMMYTFKQPGLYAYVNHNLIEAIMLGAAAHIKVEGKWNNDLMQQLEPTHSIR